MKKIHVLILSFALVAVAGVCVFLSTERAEAAVCTNPGYASDNPGPVFPRAMTGMREDYGCGSADTFIWLSRYWASSTVEVPSARLRIFYNIHHINSAPHTFDTITFQTLSTGNHLCGSNIQVRIPQSGQTQNMHRNPGAGCAIQMPAGLTVHKGMLQQDPGRYGNDIRFVDLDMDQLTASANAPIRVVASYWGAMITFEENNRNALWSHGAGAEKITYVMNFSPDCSLADGNTRGITLRWFDADWGAPPQNFNVFTMYLVDDDTGAHLTPPGGLRSDSYPFGGDNVPGSWSTTVTGGHRYRWIWAGIVRSNGIQFEMPFSEINSAPAATCIPPDVCPNIPGNQATVPAGYYQHGGNCYINHQPHLGASVDCPNRRIVVTTSDANTGTPNYQIDMRYRVYNYSTGAWGGWSGWSAITTAGNGTRYHNQSAAQDFNALNIEYRTLGSVPPGASQGYVYASVTYGRCAHASCSASVASSSPFYINAPITINFTIRNAGERNGRTWGSSEGYRLLRGASGNTVERNLTSNIGVGANWTFSATVTPTSVGNQTFQWQMARSTTRFGNLCQVTVGVQYRPPAIVCTVDAPTYVETSTTETVELHAHYNNAGAPPSATVTIARVTGAGTTWNAVPPNVTLNAGLTGRDFTNNNYAFNVAGNTSLSGLVRVQYNNGLGSTVNAPDANCPADTSTGVGGFPYLKEYGGDVWTGGNFTGINNCQPPTGSGGNIFAFNRQVSGSYVGASAQLTVTALLNIAGANGNSRGFASASNRNTANTFPPKGLTFANIGAGQPGNTYGGGFGANSYKCITDYFNDTRDSTLEASGSFPPAPATVPVPVYGANIGPSATISSSSDTPNVGIPQPPGLSDDTVVDGITNVWNTGEWASRGQLAGGSPASGTPAGYPWVQLNWGTSRNIGRIVLFDRINHLDHVLGGTITFSNGTSVPFGNLENTSGNGLQIDFAPRNVTWVRVTITSAAATTHNAGLAEVQVYPVTSMSTPANAFQSGRSQYHLTGDLVIDSLQIPVGSQSAVYVDGDVYINGNIQFDEGYNSLSDIPNFALIVRGNIYIGSGVTRLDGLYIAQPDSAASTNGIIYTCATRSGMTFSPCTPSNVQTTGNRQLSINGGLIANHVKFLRTYSSLTFAQFGETPNFATGTGTGSGGGGNTNAAEIINYTPHMYLAPSAMRTPGEPEGGEDQSGATGSYDSIRSLPPVY